MQETAKNEIYDDPSPVILLGTIVSTIQTSDNFPNTNGWLLCDGSEIPVEYQGLIALIGANTPNLSGRVLVAAGAPTDALNSDGSSPNFPNSVELNITGGEWSHLLTEDEMPNHEHLINNYNGGIQLHDRSFRGEDGDERPFVINGPDSVGDPNTSGSTDKTGGNNYHNNMQPYFTVNYIIYAIG